MKGKKRKATGGEHAAGAENVPKQSAGITKILKRYRSTRQPPGEVPVQDGGLVKSPAAAPSDPEPADAVFQRPDTVAEDTDDAPAAGNVPESTLETAGQRQDNGAHLPASQSRPGQREANEPEEEREDRRKHKTRQKQPKQASDAVLPWMRLPVSITAGQGVQLGDVGGLDPRLRDKMRAGRSLVGTPQLCSFALAVDLCRPTRPETFL